MEHFAVVQSLIRAALSGDKESAAKQVLRLRDRLEKTGDKSSAATIARLLETAGEVKELRPSQIEVSRALVTGERLTSDVQPPIDRETGARLCTIILPENNNGIEPVYSPVVRDAVDGILTEWSNTARLVEMQVEPTRSLLIFGPPGSGKTLTAQYIARRLSLPLITARIDGLVSSFLGTTARNIANLFDFANRYACVLLLDEFDALAKLRDDPQEVGEIKRVVNTLLQNLDQRRPLGVTIAITNHDRLLDPAVWRRFESQLHMGEPGDRAREHLISKFLSPVAIDTNTLAVFAYVLDGQSGADLQRLCEGVKRFLAVRAPDKEEGNLFHALAVVIARLPAHRHPAAAHLARDPDWFVSYAANDKRLKLTQEALGEVVGKTQYQISRLKSDKPYLPAPGTEHAE